MKILLVDDDEGLRSHLAKELEARAFEVLQAQSGDPVLRKPFRLEEVLRLLRQPVLPLGSLN